MKHLETISKCYERMTNKIAASWIDLIRKHARNEVFLYHIGYNGRAHFLKLASMYELCRSFFRFCFATSYINGIGIWTRIPSSLILRSYDAFPIAIYFASFFDSHSPRLTPFLIHCFDSKA